MNREQWLTDLAKQIEPIFAGHNLPDYRVACSWPSKRAVSSKNKALGECWPAECSESKTIEIMVSMGIDDPLVVAETLVHEMVHAADGNKHGHKAPFKQCALTVGLEGKMTATHAGPELKERLNALLEGMPDYPHARLNALGSKKKQSTRMLKAYCECGYTVRLTRKWADLGAPICPQCEVAMNMTGGKQ
jgi:hypothetical protein